MKARECEALGPEGAEAISEILNQVETELKWPAQVLLNLIVYLAKAGGGERPVTLSSALYRLYGKIRKPEMAAWTEKKAGFWDTAVKGSSALKTALMREFWNEVCLEKGLEAAELLLDMEKFFDTLKPEILAPRAIELGYPPIFLYLGLLVHRAARVLKGDGTHSDPQIVQQSILAGCVQSVDWTRAHLFDLLDDLHMAYRPTQIKSWVDDLALRAQGLAGTTAERVINAGKALMTGLVERGGRISPKTVILGSSRKHEI